MANGQTHQPDQKADPAIEGRRHLSKKWWIVLIVLGFLAWASFGAMGLMPSWLWVIILATLILAAFAIALFAPRRAPR